MRSSGVSWKVSSSLLVLLRWWYIPALSSSMLERSEWLEAGEIEEPKTLLPTCGRRRKPAALEGDGSVVTWLSWNWRAFLFRSNTFFFSGVSIMGELGGLEAVHFWSPRCNRPRLLQRQEEGLLLLPLLLSSSSLLLGTWMAAGPRSWLRVMGLMVVVSLCSVRSAG
jgi:hypothetical protein